MSSRVLVRIVSVLVLGCGKDDGLGQRYKVQGRVTYKSEAVEHGQITFTPVDTTSPARDATGTIQDGNYTLSTIGGNDGAFPGSYRVAIVAKSSETSKVQPI